MENVNHPAHYVGNIETIDYLEDKQSVAGHIGYLEGNIIKYISRWRKKNGVEDLAKANWYLNRLIEFVENNQQNLNTLNIWEKKLP